MFEIVTVEVPWALAYVSVPICVVYTLISSSIGLIKTIKSLCR